MYKNKIFFILLILFAFIILSQALNTPISGNSYTAEVNPQISIPAHRSDTARAIDAYERLMERYMDQNSREMNELRNDMKRLESKIDKLDKKLTLILHELSGYKVPQEAKPAKERKDNKQEEMNKVMEDTNAPKEELEELFFTE